MPMHHVAYACRDIVATTAFYEDLMGFPLVHTEVSGEGEHFLRHVFFDTGDGSCIAFFDLHGVGETPNWSTSLADPNGVPVWVNHIAFRADRELQESVRERMIAADVKPLMELDHGWCHSLYYLDPNGIMVELCRDTPGIPDEAAQAHERLMATASTHPPARPIG
jgi:catechol 2,3-dioxygenase-like lactoylglutathione lyase family enzyme